MKTYEITYSNGNGIYSANLVIAESAEQATAYYAAEGREVVGCTETMCRPKPGQPVVTVPEGWTTPAAAPETEAETESAERAAEIADAAAIDMARSIISARCSRSAWGGGVLKYAAELLEWLAADQCARRAIGMPVTPFAEVTAHDLNVRLRNGARDWHEYSYGGCALIYDGDIAARLCTASELRRTHNGQRDPNPRETWLDVQARALTSAAAIACDAVVKGARA